MDEMSLETCLDFKKLCGVQTCESMLDVVFLWANGSDPIFYEKLARTRNDSDFNPDAITINRFRELGQFRYSMRSIQRNFPHARRIFIVTNGQAPDWLDLNHVQIRLIDHSQLTPHRNMNLFNSMAIQSMVHTIPTISSPFLYSEDDIYFANPVPLEKIWDRNAKKSIFYLGMAIRNGKKKYDNFEKSVFQSVKLAKSRKFDISYFETVWKDHLALNGHISMMIYPEIVAKMWSEYYPKELLKMSRHSFRKTTDPHFWSLYIFTSDAKEYLKFEPNGTPTFFRLISQGGWNNLKNDILANHPERLFVCLNDNLGDNVSIKLIKDIENTFESLFPNKSKFEISV